MATTNHGVNAAVSKTRHPLSLTHPEVAAMADGWNPSKFTYGSKRKMRWRCQKGHLYTRQIRVVTAGSPCPECLGKLLIPGVNDLGSLFPEIAQEAHGWDPSGIHSGAEKKKLWKCLICHTTWVAKVYNRTKLKHGCPHCSRGKNLKPGNIVRKFSSPITETHPEVAKMLTNFPAEKLTAGSRRSLLWRCEYDHVFQMRVQDICRGTKCPFCQGNKIINGVTDFATKHPDLAKEAFNWDPTSVAPRSMAKKQWKCPQGHIYDSRIADRTRIRRRASGIGSGCPFCSGKKVLIGFNDLKTTHPELAKELVGLNPEEISMGSERSTYWKCIDGHIFRSKVFQRTRGIGCPRCAKSGYDSTQDGYLYLLRHDRWGLLQIGITNKPEHRIGIHIKRGWELLEVFGPRDGLYIRDLETGIKRHLLYSGATIGPEYIAGKFDGYSESWIEESYPVVTLKGLIEETP